MKTDHILIISISIFLIVAGLLIGFSWLFLLAGFAYCFWLYHRQMNINFRAQEADIMRAERDAKFTAVLSPHGVLSYNAGDIAFWTRKADPQISAGALPESAAPVTENLPPPVLPIIIDAPCVLLWGGRGRGKTNLARYVMKARAQKEDVLIIDPKETAPQTWPGFRIAGTDHNYAEILDALKWVNSLKQHKITVLIDEMTILKMRIPGFSEYWLQPLIEGRERGQSLWIIGQSRTARSLGLNGMYDILESFDFVVGCFYKKSTGERWAVLEEEGEPKKRCAQPGVFVSPCQEHKNSPFYHSPGAASSDTVTQDTDMDIWEEEACQHFDVIRYITYDTLHGSPDMDPQE
ncbi:MAG: hypothetical protein V2I97_17655, partial [Desulfococcaceae bacterium]|nr:hypothetical protein [Desulfococcaceae bacterium]